MKNLPLRWLQLHNSAIATTRIPLLSSTIFLNYFIKEQTPFEGKIHCNDETTDLISSALFSKNLTIKGTFQISV